MQYLLPASHTVFYLHQAYLTVECSSQLTSSVNSEFKLIILSIFFINFQNHVSGDSQLLLYTPTRIPEFTIILTNVYFITSPQFLAGT